MDPGIVLVWAGALLILCGVLWGAARALGRGRLSEPRSTGSGASGTTLEPREPSAGLRLRAGLPGFLLAALGSLLLLAGAVV
jgi:hypothetical protein